MLDTLHLKYHIQLDPKKLGDDWLKFSTEWNNSKSERKLNESYKIKRIIGTATVILKYRPSDYADNPLLTIEISSVPKLIHLSNSYLIPNYKTALNLLNKIIKTFPGIPETFDIYEGIISRIDICCHYDLGSHINDYIYGIGQLWYSNRVRAVYTNNDVNGSPNGVRFYIKSYKAEVKFYNKGLESSAREMEGILRQESSFSSTNTIERAFGKQNITIGEVTNLLLQEVLFKDLQELGLDRGLLGDIDSAYQQLLKHFDIRTARRLKDTLEVNTNSTTNNVKDSCKKLGIEKSTLYARRKQILEAGVVPAIMPIGMILKPLIEMQTSDVFPNFRDLSAVIPETENLSASFTKVKV